MPSYLETNYFRKEYGKKDYPQKLCSYIYKKIFKPYIIKNKKKCKLLDIGSGKGNHLVGFSRCSLQAYGIDKRKECVKILKNFTIKYCDLEKDKIPHKNNFFDFVFSKSVIEHVSNTENFLKESYRVLKPGGRLFVSDIVTEGELPEDIKKNFDAWSGCISGALEKNKYLETIKKAGFKDIKIVNQSSFSEVGLDKRLIGKITSIQVLAKK